MAGKSGALPESYLMNCTCRGFARFLPLCRRHTYLIGYIGSCSFYWMPVLLLGWSVYRRGFCVACASLCPHGGGVENDIL